MPTFDDLLGYVRKGLEQGVTREQLTEVLVQSGWAAQDVDKAIIIASHPDLPSEATQPTAPDLHGGTKASGSTVDTTHPSKPELRPQVKFHESHHILSHIVRWSVSTLWIVTVAVAAYLYGKEGQDGLLARSQQVAQEMSQAIGNAGLHF